MIEEIDQQTVAIVNGLINAVETSAEARALASLNISISLRQIRQHLAERTERQFGVLSVLSEEIATTRAKAELLESHALELESRFAETVRQLETGNSSFKLAGKSNERPFTATALVGTDSLIPLTIEQVPTAVIAFRIQKFISAQPDVVDVIARRFANGLLRFDLRMSDRLPVPDLSRASAGGLVAVELDFQHARFALVDSDRFLNLR